MARPGGPTAAMHDAIRIKKADEPSERTLDMLDELIGTIHRSRLATFAARSRKHEKRMKRRAEQLSNATASRHRNNANLQFVNEQMADEEDDRILEDLSSNFSVPVSAPAPLRKVLPKAQLFTGKAETFNRLENIDGDLQAARIFDEFRVELQQFVQNDPIRRNSVEGRGDFADYLVEKYLSQKLDPLPASKTVSGVRKTVSALVEELASASEVSSDFGAEYFGIEALGKNDELSVLLRDTAKGKDSMGRYKDGDFMAKSSAAAATTKGGNVPASTSARSELSASKSSAAAAALVMKTGKTVVINDGKVVETEAERQVREKARIKEQYEAYRRLETANTVKIGSEKKAEYEALADDIRDLLSSVQGRKT